MPRKHRKIRSGLEAELNIIDSKGYISNKADELIRRCKKKQEWGIRKEVAYSMLELGSEPEVRIHHSAASFFYNLDDAMETAERMGLHLCPLGLYPGPYRPLIRKKKWYDAKGTIYGKERFRHSAGKACGFHFHYGLPRGTFDWDRHNLKARMRRKPAELLLSQYNFLIAADPALATLMQCSPFLNGQRKGKDARILLYRTFEGNRRVQLEGLHERYPSFGNLPRYRHTMEDLRHLIARRHSKWVNLMIKHGCYNRYIARERNVLDFMWGVVKINKLGTTEYRGMDMNHPKYVLASAVLLKSALLALQEQGFQFVSSDIGQREPFKKEGNIVHIPPSSYVRHYLQFEGAIAGLENPDVLKYCERFYKFCSSFTPNEYRPAIAPLKELLERRRTVADDIIREARKAGYSSTATLPKEFCAELALRHAETLGRELDQTKSRFILLDEMD